MGDKRNIGLCTAKMTGDSPRKSTKFTSLLDQQDNNGVGVFKSSEDAHYWLTYKYAVGFSAIVGMLTYLLIEMLI